MNQAPAPSTPGKMIRRTSTKRCNDSEDGTREPRRRVIVEDPTGSTVSSLSNGSYYSRERTAATNASIVEDLVLVVEIVEDGNHVASLLMETSDTQFYDVRGSDRNPHFHILGSYQMARYLESLNYGRVNEDRFVEIENDVVQDDSTLPKHYYIILKSTENYDLKYATVRNNIQDDERLNAVVSTIPFQYIANEMFLTKKGKAKKDDSSDRGNYLWNAGYTPRDCTDGTTEPGMNIPNRMTALSKYKGHGNDRTLEHTVVRGCCALYELSKLVYEEVPSDMPMAETQFGATGWHDMFTIRWGESLGFSGSELSNMVFTGCSVFGTGETDDYSILKTEKHIDPGNSSERGHDHSVTVVKIVTVYPEGSPPFKIRLGKNIYDKKGCGDAVEKKRVNIELAKGLVAWRKENPERFMELSDYTSGYDRFRPPPRLNRRLQTWTEDASADKDLYYSYFANELHHLASSFGNDRRLMVEALLTVCMTPCPIRWREAIREAGAKLRSMMDINEQNPEVLYPNFFYLYCNARIEKSGSVSGGGIANRCQPSFPGKVSVGNMLRSVAALESHLNDANKTDKTKALITRMTSRGDRRIEGVGAFYAQTLVNIATKLLLITNTRHALSPVVAHTTTTFKRMKEYGVNTKEHGESVVPWVSNHLGWKNDVLVESGFCEWLRDENRIKKKDVFARGHVLYRIVGDNVVRIRNDGKRVEDELIAPTVTGTYQPSGKWWDITFKTANVRSLKVDDEWMNLTA
jgi:hypothetical protein